MIALRSSELRKRAKTAELSCHRDGLHAASFRASVPPMTRNAAHRNHFSFAIVSGLRTLEPMTTPRNRGLRIDALRYSNLESAIGPDGTSVYSFAFDLKATNGAMYLVHGTIVASAAHAQCSRHQRWHRGDPVPRDRLRVARAPRRALRLWQQMGTRGAASGPEDDLVHGSARSRRPARQRDHPSAHRPAPGGPRQRTAGLL